MKLIQILTFALLLPISADACLNVSGTSIHGDSRTTDYSISTMLRHSLATTAEDRMIQFERNLILDGKDELTQTEIEGVRDICEGRTGQAIETFKKIEADHPGRYSTAANLGTAYELNGDLELALKWIEEGIRRNPNSHGGTEWLHVVILRTRMKLKEDDGFLDQRHLITLPESISKTTMIGIDGQEYSAAQVAEALIYQLGERMYFVKPPDPVVADLIFTAAILEAHLAVVEPAIEMLEIARTYGFKDTTLLDRTKAGYESLIRFRKLKPKVFALLGILTFSGLVVTSVSEEAVFPHEGCPTRP